MNSTSLFPQAPRAALCLSLLVTPVWNGRAAALSDDFSGGVNPQNWLLVSNTPLYAVDASQGDVRLSKPEGGGLTFKYVGLEWKHELRGNFDVQVGFRNARIDQQHGSPGNQIQLNLSFGGQGFCVVRSDESYHNHHVWADPPGSWYGAQPNPATNGVLRVTRTNVQVSAYFDSTLFWQAAYNTNPVTVLSFVLQNNGTSDPTEVTFDNFAAAAAQLWPRWPVITSPTNATGRLNRPFNYAITATGSPTGYGAAGLPAGLSVNRTSGVISGTPASAGSFPVLLSATNGSGVGTTNLALEIVPNSPVPWPAGQGGNDHWYQAIWVPQPGLNWLSATTAATNAHGYLATVTSGAENSFVYALVQGDEFWFLDAYGNGGGPWLGAIQPAGSPEPGGNWGWITGEPFSYAGWEAHEPDNFLGNQDRICYFGYQTLKSPFWDDRDTTSAVQGYVIEWNEAPFPPVITSPSNAHGLAGIYFSFAVQALHQPTNYAATGLPGGLSLDPRTGLISGTVPSVGTNQVLLRAQNAFGVGTQWLTLAITAVPVSGPASRLDYALAFYPPLGGLILHGGWAAPGWTPRNDTWKLDVLGWKQLPLPEAPALARHSMTFDVRRGVLVMCGQTNPATTAHQTFEFDGTGWRSAPQVPLREAGEVEVAYDPIRQRVVLYWAGLPDTVQTVETWEYDGQSWIQMTPPQMPVSCPQGALLKYDPTFQAVMLVGAGASGEVETWLWEGRNWSHLKSQPPTAAVGGGLAFQTGLGRMVLLATNLATWVLEAPDWRPLHPPHAPAYPTLTGFSLEYDPLRQVAAFVGPDRASSGDGAGNSSTTWEWDGMDWSVFPSHVPIWIRDDPSGGAVTLSWPAVAADFRPEGTPRLPAVGWRPVTNAVFVWGDWCYTTNRPAGGNQFFRLRK